MEDHWYGSPEVSGSSPGPVKFSLPIFQIICQIENENGRQCKIAVRRGLKETGYQSTGCQSRLNHLATAGNYTSLWELSYF